jgi:hydroxymethylglutaryl-CoA lyase
MQPKLASLHIPVRQILTRARALRSLHHLAPLRVPDSVRIVEVGPRDGLQNEKSLVSIHDKIELITKLAESGCSYIETGSFVSHKAVPAMQNSFEVMKTLSLPSWRERWDHDIVLACLVPNMKYFNQALESNVDEIAIFASASETFSQKVSQSCSLLVPLSVDCQRGSKKVLSVCERILIVA